ncbi:MAG: DUF4783 domain-containing protein [Tannerellaceae bacterium]
MKQILTLLAISTLAIILYSFSIQKNDIAAAFKQGNAQALSSDFDTVVDIQIGSQSGKVAPREAVKKLESFFRQNTPSGFDVVHSGEKRESGFMVGKLTTSGRTYRVNITYKVANNNLIIQSIRIDESND